MIRTPFFLAMVVTCRKAVLLGAGAAATLYVMRFPKKGLLTLVEAPCLNIDVCILLGLVLWWLATRA